MLTGTPIALTVLLALAAPPPSAGGDGVAIRVEFDAPAGCSSADTFYGGLLARMSRARRALPGEDAIRLAVRLTRVGNRVRGELRLMGGGRGEGDTRRVEGETCDAVVEVLSLTAALALVERTVPPAPPPAPSHPPPSRSSASSSSSSSSSQSSSSSSQTSSSSPDKGSKPAPPEAAKPPEAEQKPPEQKPPERSEEPAAVTIAPAPKPAAPAGGRRFELGLRAVGAAVNSSGVSVGGGLSLRFEKNAAEGAGASVGLSFLYASNDLLQKADNVAVNWMALAATACPGWSVGRTVTLQPCAQAIGGWLAATGRGISHPDSVGRTWWSVGALLRGAARLGAGFSVELEAGASVPLARRSFVISTPEGTVGQTPTVAPIVALGLSRSL